MLFSPCFTVRNEARPTGSHRPLHPGLALPLHQNNHCSIPVISPLENCVSSLSHPFPSPIIPARYPQSQRRPLPLHLSFYGLLHHDPITSTSTSPLYADLSTLANPHIPLVVRKPTSLCTSFRQPQLLILQSSTLFITRKP